MSCRRGRRPRGIVMVIYTSGTTGPPKGVLMPRRALAANLDALAEAWRGPPRTGWSHGLPIFHVHGLGLGYLRAAAPGWPRAASGTLLAAGVAAGLPSGGTMLFGVPTMYHRLAEAAEGDAVVARPSPARGCWCRARRRCRAKTFERIERARAADGRALRADRDDHESPPSAPTASAAPARSAGRSPGSSCACSPRTVPTRPPTARRSARSSSAARTSSAGYLGRPEATAEVLRDGWFWTGDLATRAADGYLRIVGRKSTDLIKTGGFKVGAGEVEGALLEHPSVCEAAVAGAPDADLGEHIVAWIVLAPGCPRALPRRPGRPRRRPARPPQAPPRSPLPPRAAPQRDGQGRQGATRLAARLLVGADHAVFLRGEERFRFEGRNRPP